MDMLERHSFWIMNSVEWSTRQLEAGVEAQATKKHHELNPQTPRALPHLPNS
jgi:hypothetical protein